MSPEHLFVLEKKYSKNDGAMLKEYIRWLEEILSTKIMLVMGYNPLNFF